MIFAVSAGMPLHAASSEKKENKTVASEDALPSLALDGLPDVWIQGTPVKEWEKDKVYIFEFWATWCGPCLAAMPHMEQLHQAFKNNPHMQVIGVNVMDRKSPESLKEFLRNRPSPLTYAMAVDVDGKKTRDKWLSPMGVNGIPHAFAVKNGKLIWRGHPGKLSEEMMRAMLKPDFSAASLPGDNPGANARAWKLYRQVSERTGELARKGGKGEAQAFLRQIQDSGQFQQDQIIQLKMVPFRVLAELEKFQEAQAVLDDLCKEYPDNYRVQIDVAGTLLNGKSVPAGKMDAALVERCLNRCIEISRRNNKEASLPWKKRNVNLKLKLAKIAAAGVVIALLIGGLGHPHEIKAAWEQITSWIQTALGINENVESYIDSVGKTITKNGISITLDEIAADKENLWVAISDNINDSKEKETILLTEVEINGKRYEIYRGYENGSRGNYGIKCKEK